MDIVGLVVLIGLFGGAAYWYQQSTRTKLSRDIESGHRAAMGAIICPNQNCGYIGQPREEARGSVIAGLFFCCLFILPGLIYFIVRSGNRRLCPKCGLQISADN